MGRLMVGWALLAALAAVPASAQDPLDPGQGFEDLPRIGVGYVTNAPNIFTGVSAYTTFGVLGGMGLYVDGKFKRYSPESESDFVDSLTVAQVEALPSQEADVDEYQWWSVNVALVRPISPELMVYLGAGYTQEEVYWRYQDLLGVTDIGEFDRYWIHDEVASGPRVNVLGGAFFRMSQRVALQIGLETAPQGATVGGSYSFGF